MPDLDTVIEAPTAKRAGKSSFASAPYRRIEADMRARIRGGQWPAGSLVASRRDLAREYGVELSTIQRAVNRLMEDKTLVARAGVGTYVAERDETRLQLKPMPLGAMAILVDRLVANPFAEQIAGSIERHFSSAGGSIHLVEFGQNRRKLDIHDALRNVVDQGYVAVALIDLDQSSVDELVASVPGLPEATIFVSGTRCKQPICNVWYDNYDAGFQAAQHLIDRGCHDVLYVPTYDRQLYWVDERLEGIKDAFARRGFPAESVRISHEGQYLPPGIDRCVQAGIQAVEEDFASRTPSGVIGVNDRVSHAIMIEAAKRGIHAGTDYALIGFDDQPEFRSYKLSTLRQPLEEMGREAARLACQVLRGEAGVRSIKLRCHLVVRASSYNMSGEPFTHA